MLGRTHEPSHTQHLWQGPFSYLHATSRQRGLGAEHSFLACRKKQLIALVKTQATTDNRWKQCARLAHKTSCQSKQASPSTAPPQSSPGPCYSSAFPDSFAAAEGITLQHNLASRHLQLEQPLMHSLFCSFLNIIS